MRLGKHAFTWSGATFSIRDSTGRLLDVTVTLPRTSEVLSVETFPGQRVRHIPTTDMIVQMSSWAGAVIVLQWADTRFAMGHAMSTFSTVADNLLQFRFQLGTASCMPERMTSVQITIYGTDREPTPGTANVLGQSLLVSESTVVAPSDGATRPIGSLTRRPFGRLYRFRTRKEDASGDVVCKAVAPTVGSRFEGYILLAADDDEAPLL